MGSVVALVACALVMLFTTFVLLDVAEDKVTSVTEGIAGWRDAEGRPAAADLIRGGPERAPVRFVVR